MWQKIGGRQSGRHVHIEIVYTAASQTSTRRSLMRRPYSALHFVPLVAMKEIHGSHSRAVDAGATIRVTVHCHTRFSKSPPPLAAGCYAISNHFYSRDFSNYHIEQYNRHYISWLTTTCLGSRLAKRCQVKSPTFAWQNPPTHVRAQFRKIMSRQAATAPLSAHPFECIRKVNMAWSHRFRLYSRCICHGCASLPLVHRS